MPASPPLAEAVKEAVKDKEVQIALGAVAAGASVWALYRYYKYGIAPWESVYTDAGVFPKKKVCMFASHLHVPTCPANIVHFPWTAVRCTVLSFDFLHLRTVWTEFASLAQPQRVYFGKVEGENRGPEAMEKPIVREDPYFWMRDDKRKSRQVITHLNRCGEGNFHRVASTLTMFSSQMYCCF
jgi:hypothetical protein